MSTIEKLFIIDEIPPPPGLHSSSLHHSHTSDFKEVNPNFISNAALVVDDREELQHRLNVDDSSLRNNFDAAIRPSVFSQCSLNDDASNPGMSPISPQGRAGVVLENYQDPNLSLERLQRSKSRQKALEFRNSVKSIRFESWCGNKDDSVPCGIMGSAISSLQSNHKDELELVKPSNNNMRDDTVEPEDDFRCEQKDISDKITTSGSPGLQRSSMDVDNSPYVFSKDERLCSIGSLNPESDNVNEQLDLSKPSSGNIECCEEADLGYHRRQENNLEDAELSGLQRNSLGVSNSSYISSEDERSCPIGSSELYSDEVQLNLSKPSSDIRIPFASPFGKLSDRISSSSSCFGKSGSLNVELPCISEENENADEIAEKFVKDTVSELITNSVKQIPLADMTENSNLQVKVSEAASDRFGLESLNTEFSNTGTIKENLGNERSSKRRYLNKAENQNISPVANRVERVTRSSYNRFSRSDLSCKDNFKKEGLRVSEKECKHKNIVSNLTSFIPLVQQREAATILKGKRDIKVKAIEAAEVAKRHAEKKENERQMKKEALKLERARMEQENLRQLELEKKKKEEERKKKEEERKKKEADMAAKKRQREDEERKEKQRKRMRVEEVRKRQRGNGGKLRYDKEKEVKLQANDQNPRDKKGGKDETEKRVKGSESDNFDKLSVSESIIASTCGAERASFVMETQVPKNVMVNRVSEISEESYQISPYKGSDDEDEEDDDHKLNNKFVPSWARKDCLALLFASQLKVNPEFIFPPESFCDIAEVLLPRKHQSKIK